MTGQPRRSPLFPTTTLSRSRALAGLVAVGEIGNDQRSARRHQLGDAREGCLRNSDAIERLVRIAGRHHFPFWRNQLLAQLLARSEEHTSELQSQSNLVCRLL